MNTAIHIANYFLLFSLKILYILSIICEIKYIKKNNHELLFYLYIIDLSILGIVFILSFLFGFGSLYFSSKEKLLHYIITLIFIFLSQSGMIIFLFLKKIYEDELINFISIGIQVFFCLLNLILSIIERAKLIQEIKESPLNYVDENITEDMYKNILSQSLNPENAELKENFKKYISKKRNSSTNSSNTVSSNQTN